MYTDTLNAVSAAAEKKAAYYRSHPLGYLVASALAGAYVGVGVMLAFAVGGPLAAAGSPWVKIAMGASFTIALALVVFAGAELFTGNNLAMTVGRWQRQTTLGQLVSNWTVSWVGNLLGAILLAWLLYLSAVLNGSAELALVQQVAAKKMHLLPMELLTRGILCNFLVCLAVWCTYRMKSETGKLIMIFWCLYAFVASGFEHCVANMTLLPLALLQPHAAEISWLGMGYNLCWVTLGNILGGALFVGGAYQLTSQNRMNDTSSTPDHATTPTPTG